MLKSILSLSLLLTLVNCKSTSNVTFSKEKFQWKSANLYFLLVDRFYNGDKSNDKIILRNQPTAKLRGFEGGDIRGIIQKLDEGYFEKLGIQAIWLSPIVEQVHGCVDEGTGNTYGFHGYWTKDWTSIDPSFGTRLDLKELVDKAHQKGIRIVLDAVINHTGPVTTIDPVWPSEWVRTSPKCTYNSYDNYINCTLVENLPDIKTESNQDVSLPPNLIAKWKKEGRYEQEIAELDAFFKKTGYPRAPKYYIMKWLADYILDFGIDGYRVDTVKHVYEDVWADFRKVCNLGFEEYKIKNSKKLIDSSIPFFMAAEVYGYYLNGRKIYDFGDKKVDYFANGFDACINFDFKIDAGKNPEDVFKSYSNILNNDLKGFTTMNYISSHDDGSPYDQKREKAIQAGTMLLLTPGISQIYYGDETARSLEIQGTKGDATLRSIMNWEETNLPKNKAVLEHYQKLGQFRKNHPAVGGGVHEKISDSSYYFKRTLGSDTVIVGLNLEKEKVIAAPIEFPEGTKVKDAYSGAISYVNKGKIYFSTNDSIVLIEKI